MGEQTEPFEGSRLFVVPNPSGLNAHETTSTLAAAYRAAAEAAGLELRDLPLGSEPRP
jgi:TDG/mug DNA glycosylase family protein